MKKYIAVLEVEDDEEIIDASVSYSYRSNGMNYKATERMELKEESGDTMNKTYEDGLNDAWEAARKIVYLPSVGGYSASELLDIFGRTDISSAQLLKHNTAAEVIAKIKEYENRIEVGDEVTDDDGWKGVVTWISPDGEYMVVVLQDGSALRWKKESFKKTGRHFPQIAEVLKQMQEEEDGRS